MRARQIVIITAAVISVLSGCKQPEAISETTAKNGQKPEVLIAEVRNSEFGCETLSMRSSATFTADGKSTSFKAIVRLRKDSAIWLSLNKANLEAARILITPDSIKFINRIERSYFVGDYSKIDSLFQIELDFDDLQALILGNSIGIEMPPELDKEERKEERLDDKEERKDLRDNFKTEIREERADLKKVKKAEDRTEYKTIKKDEKDEWKDERKELREAIGKNGFPLPLPPLPVVGGERNKPNRIRIDLDDNQYYVSTWRQKKLQRLLEKDKPLGTDEIVYSAWFDPDTYKPQKLSVFDIASRKAMFTTFSAFETVAGQQFPTKTEITVEAESKATLVLEHSKISVDEPEKFSFRIPPKYEQID